MQRTLALATALFAALFLGVTSGIARAEPPPPPPPPFFRHPPGYLVLKAGVYSPSNSFDLDNFNAGNTTRLDSKTGFNGEIAVGYYLAPMLALELGVGYFESNGSPEAPPGKTTLAVIPVLLSGKLLLPLGPIEPYGEFGIGAYFSDFNVSGNLQDGFRGGTDTTYGLHAGAGVNINVGRYAFLNLEGRYLWAEPSYGGQDVRIDGFTVTAGVGFRY